MFSSDPKHCRCQGLVHSGFDQLDQNKDGYISEGDLIHFIHLKGILPESSEIGKIFLQYTTQVAGKVDLAEVRVTGVEAFRVYIIESGCTELTVCDGLLLAVS